MSEVFGSIPNEHFPSLPHLSLTSDQVHWRTNPLIEVPPVRLVTEMDPVALRTMLARFIDGRHINDVLYRAVLAIRKEYDLEPYPYVIAIRSGGVELPVDLMDVSDEPGQFVGVVLEPRSVHVPPFALPESIAERAHQASPGAVDGGGPHREQVFRLLKELSEEGEPVVIQDLCGHGERFVHQFADGCYHHSHRSIATTVPELGRA